MEWQQLEHFRIVAKTEHFTKAAEQLAITQPALSRSIAKLEEELGAALFDRMGRSVRLSKSGKLFLQRVERALQEIQYGIEELRDLNSPYSGTVSLAFLLTFGFNILPDIIGKFNRLYPNVEFDLHQDSTEDVIRLLERGDVDLCLVGPFGNRQGKVWHKLFEEELFIYVPAGHKLAERTSLQLDELAEEPFISLKKGYGLRTLTDRFCGEAGFVPRIRFEGEDVATVAGLVSSGLGVTLIPAFGGIDSSKIRQVRVTEPLCRRELGLAWIEGRRLPPSAELFRRFIIEHFDM